MQIADDILKLRGAPMEVDYYIKQICFKYRLDIIRVKIDFEKLIKSNLLIFLCIKTDHEQTSFIQFLSFNDTDILVGSASRPVESLKTKDLTEIWDGECYIINPSNNINMILNSVKYECFSGNKRFLEHYLEKHILDREKRLEIKFRIHPFKKNSAKIAIKFLNLYLDNRSIILLFIEFAGSKFDSLFVEFKLYHDRIDVNHENYVLKLTQWLSDKNRNAQTFRKLFPKTIIHAKKTDTFPDKEMLLINNSFDLLQLNNVGVYRTISNYINSTN